MQKSTIYAKKVLYMQKKYGENLHLKNNYCYKKKFQTISEKN